MSILCRINDYKNSHPKLKQTTIRVSEDCLKRVKKFAKKNDIGEGVALWLLVEEGLEGADGYEAQKTVGPIEELRVEVDSLKQEVAVMKGLMAELVEKAVEDADDVLGSEKSHGLSHEESGEVLPAAESPTDEGKADKSLEESKARIPNNVVFCSKKKRT